MSGGRWFYRDPLAAAWMAKHFGMRFTIRDGVYIPTWQDLASSGNADGYFVLPDDLHLLEPMVGDLIRSVDANCDHLVYRVFQSGDDTGISLEDWFRINQRDGKPFMWPECEP